MLGRIEVVPPGGVVLEEAGEPGHLGGKPLLALGVIENVMVLTFDLDEGNLTT